MVCSKRSTRILPGLSQALDWLRQNLPPGTESSPVLIPVPVRTSPQTRRPAAAKFRRLGAHHRD